MSDLFVVPAPDTHGNAREDAEYSGQPVDAVGKVYGIDNGNTDEDGKRIGYSKWEVFYSKQIPQRGDAIVACGAKHCDNE